MPVQKPIVPPTHKYLDRDAKNQTQAKKKKKQALNQKPKQAPFSRTK